MPRCAACPEPAVDRGLCLRHLGHAARTPEGYQAERAAWVARRAAAVPTAYEQAIGLAIALMADRTRRADRHIRHGAPRVRRWDDVDD